ncbi:hypothetical protein QJS10_CPB19g01257 [Acorus calamus]|uniref:Uncharacterized protein n=1 Tax=Acorus calamus TaxID=4465 RepID=A0AAV9CH61_ACOCL|nr:hypothetical protein QJS10_CPB19g01257 [Acorus calamus]
MDVINELGLERELCTPFPPTPPPPNSQLAPSIASDNDYLCHAYVEKSHHRYLLISRLFDHPIFRVPIERCGDESGGDATVMSCEVVLFEHLRCWKRRCIKALSVDGVEGERRRRIDEDVEEMEIEQPSMHSRWSIRSSNQEARWWRRCGWVLGRAEA